MSVATMNKFCRIIFRTDQSDAGITASAASSMSSGDSCSVQEDDSEDFTYSVSNPPTPNQTRKKMTSDAESENTFVSGTSSQSSSSTHTMSPTEKQNSMFTNSTEAVLGRSFMSGFTSTQHEKILCYFITLISTTADEKHQLLLLTSFNEVCYFFP